MVGPLWLVTALLTAVARGVGLVPGLWQGIPLLLFDVVVPVLVFSVALAVVTANLAAIERGESAGFLSGLKRLEGRWGTVLAVGLVPTVVAIALALPPTTRLLLLLLFNGVIGPPLMMQAATLTDDSFKGALDTARGLLAGRGPRTILYLVNVVVGTGLLGLVLGGAISYATIGNQTVQLIALPVQTLVASAIFGYVVAFEFVLFRHLETVRDATPD